MTVHESMKGRGFERIRELNLLQAARRSLKLLSLLFLRNLIKQPETEASEAEAIDSTESIPMQAKTTF